MKINKTCKNCHYYREPPELNHVCFDCYSLNKWKKKKGMYRKLIASPTIWFKDKSKYNRREKHKNKEEDI